MRNILLALLLLGLTFSISWAEEDSAEESSPGKYKDRLEIAATLEAGTANRVVRHGHVGNVDWARADFLNGGLTVRKFFVTWFGVEFEPQRLSYALVRNREFVNPEAVNYPEIFRLSAGPVFQYYNKKKGLKLDLVLKAGSDYSPEYGWQNGLTFSPEFNGRYKFVELNLAAIIHCFKPLEARRVYEGSLYLYPLEWLDIEWLGIGGHYYLYYWRQSNPQDETDSAVRWVNQSLWGVGLKLVWPKAKNQGMLGDTYFQAVYAYDYYLGATFIGRVVLDFVPKL